MAHKAMWDWMDKAEGKKEGSSHANLKKEMKRQGVHEKGESKKHEIAEKMKKMSKSERLSYKRNVYHAGGLPAVDKLERENPTSHK